MPSRRVLTCGVSAFHKLFSLLPSVDSGASSFFRETGRSFFSAPFFSGTFKRKKKKTPKSKMYLQNFKQ